MKMYQLKLKSSVKQWIAKTKIVDVKVMFDL